MPLTPEESIESHRSAFASATYRRYFPSAVFSTLGSWLLRFLLGWSAWELTESATWVGIVAGLTLAPALLLSPLFGIVADRVNPRNGLLLTITLQAFFAGVAGIAVLFDVFTLSALLTLATALGITTSAHTPIRLALIPLLVTRPALPSAIGYSAMVFNTSRILGPALGAWLISQGSTALAYCVAGGLMLSALPNLWLAHVVPPAKQDSAGASFRQQLTDGLRYTRNHQTIRVVFGFTLVNALLGRTIIELLPALSGLLLQGDSSSLATLTAAAGAGSIIGGLVVSRQRGSQYDLQRLLALSLLSSAVVVTGLSFGGQLIKVSLLISLLSLTATMAGTSSQALAQLLVEDGYRGRVLSLWTMIAMGAPAAGAMTMGSLADWLSFPPVLLGFALAGGLVTLGLYRAVR